MFPQVDAVLSGYQGGAGIADVIVDAVRRVKAENPSAVYACDPVMGNAKSGCFVAPEIPVLLRDRVVPVADIITPNQFELGFLTGTEPASVESTLASADLARAMGPSTVLVTSVERPDREQDTIEMLVVDDAGAWLVITPRLPFKANGPATSPPPVHRPLRRDRGRGGVAGAHGLKHLRPDRSHVPLGRAGTPAGAGTGVLRITAHAVHRREGALTAGPGEPGAG